MQDLNVQEKIKEIYSLLTKILEHVHGCTDYHNSVQCRENISAILVDREFGDAYRGKRTFNTSDHVISTVLVSVSHITKHPAHIQSYYTSVLGSILSNFFKSHNRENEFNTEVKPLLKALLRKTSQ